jgi:hypothetical protein
VDRPTFLKRRITAPFSQETARVELMVTTVKFAERAANVLLGLAGNAACGVAEWLSREWPSHLRHA